MGKLRAHLANRSVESWSNSALSLFGKGGEFAVSLHKIMALVEAHDRPLALVLHLKQMQRLMRDGCAPTSPGGDSPNDVQPVHRVVNIVGGREG